MNIIILETTICCPVEDDDPVQVYDRNISVMVFLCISFICGISHKVCFVIMGVLSL